MRVKLFLVSLVLIWGNVGVGAAAQIETQPAPSQQLTIKQCSIYVEGAAGKPIDCSVPVRAACAGKPACEIGIGRNLTGGQEQPEAAKVLIAFSCGATNGEAGPHQFNDHASATLSCGFTD